jgi:hypothetical protein
MTAPTQAAPLTDDVDTLEEVLSHLSVLVIAKITQLWAQYGTDPDVIPILRAAIPELVAPFTQGAAAVTAQWYDELSPSSDFTASPVVDLPAEKIDSTVRWAAYAPGQASPRDRLAGAAQKWVYDASRDTVVENADAEGVTWARHAQPDACTFCRMLATREDVYSSAESATRVGGRSRGARKAGTAYHDHCRCVAIAVRAGTTYQAPAYMQEWEDQYLKARANAGSGNMTAIQAAWRQLDAAG